MTSSKSKTTIVASIACTAAMTTAKFVAAGFTGSAAMTAEGIHSLVDTSNSALLYLGMCLSAKPPDEDHPFGYSKELYFWTLLVSLVMFAVGGCANVLEGIHHILKPNELTDPAWNYAVLGISFVFDCTTWCIAFREFRRAKGNVNYREGLERVKDPSVITVLFEDTVSLAGLAFAFLGIFLGKLLNLPVLDGIASVLIGLLLGALAVGLVYQSKVLLIGEGANGEVVGCIRSVVEHDESVEEIKDLLTMHLGPQDILLNLKIRFRQNLDTRQLGESVDRLERNLRDQYPDLKRIFIEPALVDDTGQNSEQRQKAS